GDRSVLGESAVPEALDLRLEHRRLARQRLDPALDGPRDEGRAKDLAGRVGASAAARSGAGDGATAPPELEREHELPHCRVNGGCNEARPREGRAWPSCDLVGSGNAPSGTVQPLLAPGAPRSRACRGLLASALELAHLKDGVVDAGVLLAVVGCLATALRW